MRFRRQVQQLNDRVDALGAELTPIHELLTARFPDEVQQAVARHERLGAVVCRLLQELADRRAAEQLAAASTSPPEDSR